MDNEIETIHKQAEELAEAKVKIRFLETKVAQYLPHPSDWQGRPATVLERVTRAKETLANQNTMINRQSAQIENLKLERDTAAAHCVEHFVDMVQAKADADDLEAAYMRTIETANDAMWRHMQAVSELEATRTELKTLQCGRSGLQAAWDMFQGEQGKRLMESNRQLHNAREELDNFKRDARKRDEALCRRLGQLRELALEAAPRHVRHENRTMHGQIFAAEIRGLEADNCDPDCLACRIEKATAIGGRCRTQKVG